MARKKDEFETDSGRIAPDRAALVQIDWQERLFVAMPEGIAQQALRRASDLLWLAGELDMAVVTTEQYPKGLGPTLPDLRRPDPIEKLSFSAWRADDFARRLLDVRCTQVVITGMETHVCVAQTARDLMIEGFDVFVVADACLSRRKLDWRTGLQRMRDTGVLVTTAEAVMFELIGAAGTPLFKEVSRRVK